MRANVRSPLSVLCLGGLLCLNLLWSGSTSAAVDLNAFVGRPLLDALLAFNAQGHKILFSSAQINTGMIVRDEVPEDSDLNMLQGLLAQFDLMLVDGPNQIHVVKQRPATPKEIPEPASEPKATRDLETIVIAASQYDIAYSETTRPVFLNQRDIENLSHLANDVTRAVSQLPGVAGGDASAQPYIRGGHATENAYLLDGMPLESPFHLNKAGSYLGTIDAFTIGDVSIITGGATVEYGDHLSGVINLTSTDPTEDYTTGFGLNFLDLKAKVAGPLNNDGKNTGFFSLRRGFLGAVDAVSDVDATGIKPLFLDLFAKARVELTSDTALTWHSFFSQDSDTCLYQCYGSNSNSNTAYHWLTAVTDWSDDVGSTSLFGYANSRQRRNGQAEPQRYSFYDVDGEAEYVRVDDRLDWSFLLFKQDWTLSLSTTQMLKAGIELKRMTADYDYSYESKVYDPFKPYNQQYGKIRRDINARPSNQSNALYLANVVKLSRSWTMEAGLRWQQETATNEQALMPRINFDYLAIDGGNLKLSWGQFRQAQAMTQLMVEDGIDDVFPSQRVRQLNVSYQNKLAERYRYMIALFDKQYSHLSPRSENVLGEQSLFFEQDFTRQMLTPTSASAHGIELFLRQNNDERFNWWLSYTWSRSEQNIDGTWVPRRWDQRHAFNLSASYRFDNGCLINLVGKYHTGWHTTNASWHQETPQTNPSEPYFQLGALYEEPSPAFLRFDTRLGCERQFGASRLRYFIEVLNVLNRNNTSGYVEMDEVFSNQGAVTGIQGDGGNYVPFIPSIGLIWEF